MSHHFAGGVELPSAEVEAVAGHLGGLPGQRDIWPRKKELLKMVGQDRKPE